MSAVVDVPSVAGVDHDDGEDAVFDAAVSAIVPVRTRHSGRAVSFLGAETRS